MLVADLHREAARRHVDTMPISEWAHAMLEVLGAPPAGRTPACVVELVCLASAPWARAGGTLFDSRAPRAGPLLRDAGGHIDRPQGGGVQDRRHADARRRDREARPCDRRTGSRPISHAGRWGALKTFYLVKGSTMRS